MGEVRAAVVGPFSGPRAAWGELLEQGAAAHADGPVRWDFHDDRGDTALARSVAEAVVADGRYALVVGHFNSAGARAALPLYRAAGLPVLLPLATAPGLLADAAGTALRWCPDDVAQLTEIRAAARRAGHHRLAVTHDATPTGAHLAQLFHAGVLGAGAQDESPATGGQPAAPATGADSDALAAGGEPVALAAGGRGVALVAEREADALVVCGTHAGVARVARERRAAGFGGTFYFTDDCAVDEFAALLGDAAGSARVARLRGGPAAYVDDTFRTARAALTHSPEARGAALVALLRTHASHPFTPEGEPRPGTGRFGPGWDVVPLTPPPATADPTPARGPGVRHGRVYDVLVVGAGVVGAATADVLARQGLRVGMTAPSAADPAATRYSGGLVRAYEPDPALRELALRSHALAWGGTDGDHPPTGFRRTGSLVLLGEGDLPEAEKGVAELTAAGVTAHLLDPGELRSRFPGLAAHDIAGAVWEPGGGYADPPVTALALRDRAAAHRAVVLAGRARRIDQRDPDSVAVLLEQGEVRARAVVLATGAGTGRIAGHALSAPVPHTGPRTKRIRYAFFAHPDAARQPTVCDLVTGVWGRPQHGGSAAGGYLTGRPVDEWDVAPGGGDTVTAAQAEHIRELAARRWPWLHRAGFLHGRHGVDLFTRDGRPLVGPPTPGGRVVLATGWSGAGFKTAPAAGELVAAHVLEALG
ncbi:FAD-dependent oxidoreductase [Streptomyces sp. NPDC127190]|uniref:FAD-dependent oxidoreductase n=1 Tax=unclassified Streptomyces TaxID=2593676 RepID=UPI0036319CD1